MRDQILPSRGSCREATEGVEAPGGWRRGLQPPPALLATSPWRGGSWRLTTAIALALIATPALAQSIALTGPAGQMATMSAADLAKLPRVKFTFDAHGQKHDYEGPLLIDVVAKVGAPTGKAIGGREMADVVLVTASDGYQVAIGLAEADPGTRANRVIVADRSDGATLAANEGPFKLVIEGDLRPARSARMVSKISVIRLNTLP